MTGTLVIVRHAQAQHGIGEDHARQLTVKGRRQAQEVGTLLADAGILPDQVICSTSTRTRETLELALEQMPGRPQIDFEEAAYGASGRELYELVNLVPKDVGTVMLVGHNPAVAQMASEFIDLGPHGGFLQFPPASVAVVRMEVEWLYAAPGTGTGRLLTE
ncbi:histidine phosphatase family protein [Nocardiopsis sp. RSe5-2]|uniref:Histidine phosphatase family protein n=1 Tax=Nocardiopsis endophytica TaxID=3018445 RepID=A0ABT4UEU9_9ACTN|nr:histidine phosphatase family protein [Nocardiopsis endophytica]MDA2814872.1 histidine phosphatase family protein [Nocardiopsis endophytica]